MWKLIKKICCAVCKGESPDTLYELPSPRVAIDPDDVKYDLANRRIIVDNIEPDVWLVTVQDTNSMEPLIDIDHILIASNNARYMDDIKVGDVVVWDKIVRWGIVNKRLRIMHQVVEINEDSEGWCCRTQGLHPEMDEVDPYKIRKEDIKWVVLMAFWLNKHGKRIGKIIRGGDQWN